MMGRIETYACDEPGCGKQKEATNHWWAILETAGTVEIRVLQGRLREGEKTYCGNEHLTAEISRSLSRLARQGGKR
jgi:hypothetical protein